MKVIGITGGIACGKSFVTRLLASWGAQTASADEDARLVVAPGTDTLREVLVSFPEARTAEDTLDRAALARRIFADTKARRQLEAILHPAIFARMEATTAAARVSDSAPLLVYEVPLLYEKEREKMFDAVIAVVCSRLVQVERLQERERSAGRPPLTEEQLDERLSAQLSNEEKSRRADYVIRTDGTVEDTERQTRTVWLQIIGSEPLANVV